MELSKAIDLIKNGMAPGVTPQTWADLGAGNGLFTKALGTLLPTGSSIQAIDKDRHALQSIVMPSNKVTLNITTGDIEHAVNYEHLDGILIANALHYIKEQNKFLLKVKSSLASAGRLIVIEYDSNTPNRWVPFPILYTALATKIKIAGFSSIAKIGETPSRFGQGNIYSALIV